MNGSLAILRKVHWVRLFYLVLLVTGIILYLGWALYFNAWTDVGLYSIVVLMVGFGLCGYLLYTIAPDGGKK